MFSTSELAKRSFTFCVIPVGTPPHLRKRFQISTLHEANSPRSKQVELIDVVARSLAGLAVARHAVPDLVLHDQHPELFELLAQLLYVVADHAVIDVHVRPVIEHVEAAGDVNLQRRGEELRLFLVLRAETVVQVLENRHILGARVGEVVPVDHADAAVYDGLFDRLQPLF